MAGMVEGVVAMKLDWFNNEIDWRIGPLHFTLYLDWRDWFSSTGWCWKWKQKLLWIDLGAVLITQKAVYSLDDVEELGWLEENKKWWGGGR
jgi:hypothetical protein